MFDRNDILKRTITLQAFKEYVCIHRVEMVPAARSLKYTDSLHVEALGISNALGGECGELQNIVKKLVRSNTLLAENDLHEEFILEAGDTLHYLVSLITLLGYSLEEVMTQNIIKLDERRKLDDEKRQAALLAEASTERWAGESRAVRDH